MIRLVPDHAGAVRRAHRVSFTFDGEAVSAHAGESVATALLRAGRYHLRRAPSDATSRGVFCCMGLCQECAVQVDGRVVESCRQTVRGGMAVTSLARSDG